MNKFLAGSMRMRSMCKLEAECWWFGEVAIGVSTRHMQSTWTENFLRLRGWYIGYESGYIYIRWTETVKRENEKRRVVLK